MPIAQSTRKDAVISIDSSHTRGVADASRSPETEDASGVLRKTSLAQCLPSLRRQIAVARTLLDELEDSVPSSPSLIATNAQVIEELKRLGTRVLDAAAVRAEHQDADREEHLRR
jgi:hypothetical protein